jgi:hypothetical protein
MSDSVREKIGSAISLFALVVNLLPFHALPAQAATLDDLGDPAEAAHHAPQPVLVTRQAALTTVGDRPAAIMPDWFIPPTHYELSEQVDGLSLSVPPAVLRLAAALPDRAETETVPLPAARTLPAWFSAAPDSSIPNVLETEPTLADNVQPDAATIIPGWFNSNVAMPAPAKEIVESSPLWGDRGAIRTVEQPDPALLRSAGPAAVAAAPVEPGFESTILPAWFHKTADSDRDTTPANSTAPPSVLPDWFNIPPARPMRAEIPGLAVTVDAPANVSAGDEAVGGAVYTITVFNGSDGKTATVLEISATIPAIGFEYIPNSAVFHNALGVPVPYIETMNGDTILWSPVSVINLREGETVYVTFKMQTDGTAVSGQRLNGAAVYGKNRDETSAGRNVTVGRGNLIITKRPAIRNATFLDELVWTVEVANTGLGDVYSASITDTIGSGYTNVDFSGLPSTPIPVLKVSERRQFPVAATVFSCENLTNTVEAYWTIGNDEGDGTLANPVNDNTDVIYEISEPNITLQTNSIDFAYCDTVSTQTVVLTLTNSAGPALYFRLLSTLPGSPFEVVTPSVSSDWTYNDTTGVFSYTANSLGYLTDTTYVLSFDVTPSGSLCGGLAGQAITFSSRFFDACGLAFNFPTEAVEYTYADGVVPGLVLTKISSPARIGPAGSTTFIVDLEAVNTQNINGSIVVTDDVPGTFVINSIIADVFGTANDGTVVTNGNRVVWTFDSDSVPSLQGQLRINATSVSTECGAGGGLFFNTVQASAPDACPGCPPLTAADRSDILVRTAVGSSSGPKLTTSQVEACDVITVSNGYSLNINDWNGVVFTETLGNGQLSYISPSLEVIAGGTDVTADVIVLSTAPQLILDLSNVSVATGSLGLLINYSLFVSDAVVGNNQVTIGFTSTLYLPDTVACGNDTALTLSEAAEVTALPGARLQIEITPDEFVGCDINEVLLTVSPDPDFPSLNARNLVVTFTTGAPDFNSIDTSLAALENPAIFGGGFAGNPVTATVSGNLVTWEFALPITYNGSTTGSIRLELLRSSCSLPPLLAGDFLQ